MRNKERKAQYNARYYREHRATSLACSKAWHKAHPDKARVSNKLCYQTHSEKRHEQMLLRRYGLSADAYDILFRVQQGRCAICGRSSQEFKRKRRLDVDHDHQSGRVRGLLCTHCNNGLGSFDDDLARVVRAVEYLQEGPNGHI